MQHDVHQFDPAAAVPDTSLVIIHKAETIIPAVKLNEGRFMFASDDVRCPTAGRGTIFRNKKRDGRCRSRRTIKPRAAKARRDLGEVGVLGFQMGIIYLTPLSVIGLGGRSGYGLLSH
jgi:hypothetical protein